MRRLILAVSFLLTSSVFAQDVMYTPNMGFRLWKRGWTGDWVGSQTDTTGNQGINWNSIRLDFILGKIFYNNGIFKQSFRDSTVTASNLAGSGIGIFKSKDGANLGFKRMVQGGNLILTDMGDSVVVATDTTVGEANTASNVAGGGVGPFRSKVGRDLTFKRLYGTGNVTVTDQTDSVQINTLAELNTASNLAGAGVGLFKNKSGVDLRFKRIKGVEGATITDDGDSVSISTTRHISIVKAQDETVVNSTTLQDDDELSWEVGANESWVFKIVCYVNNDSPNVGLRLAVNAPSGSKLFFTSIGPINGQNTFNWTVTTVVGVAVNAYNMQPAPGFEILDGSILIGGTPGRVTLQWAQANANVVGITRMKAGSFLIAHKVE
jgi:hypothetical protein